jgi:hypothetical protein
VPDHNPSLGGMFDRLLEAMPSIATAVNSFTSEDVQRSALEALLRAAGLSGEPHAATANGVVSQALTIVPPLTEDEVDDSANGDASEGARAKQTGTRQRRARKSTVKKSWRPKDVDFRSPSGLTLRQFAEKKTPGSYYEKNAVIVYFLAESLEASPIDPGHLLAGYQHCSWKAPRDPENSLSQTKFKKGWLDTSDMNDIRITHAGRQFVEFDLPAKKANPA